MRKLLLITLTLIAFSCGSNTHTLDKSLNADLITNAVATNYANTINTSDLKTLLYQFASDEFEGRETGEPGQKLAAEYLKTFYIDHKIKSPNNDDNYFQTIPTSNLKPDLNPSENVAAFIKGTEKPDEIVVISAHYDHLGKTNTGIYYGADDDGSGTVAILEIAEAFQKAVDEGNGPKRSILFLHFTGEEKGLLGSKYYSEYPIFPLDKTVTDLNIDMIGRVDDAHINNTNYVYLIGSDKLSKELHFLSEEINEKFTNLNLDYTYNDENDPNRFYYRSDHYNFAKNNIPIIFYFNGTHKDYHKMTDTPDKINYDLLSKRAKLVFYTAWEIANRENRIALTN
ncbi:MAG: M28 family metallopeptidase [Lutibacter sp.]|uniref:M28 family metallopeptidase n=1 Tax=Lutibacter sp. TaxID=1925666 RepID=UPI00299CF195|nr:M28 family metallopeptidase [Lutibacter sp.]MDX1828304.1 M28 family metallopeptidase [Lutibacter sp.]